MELTVGGGGKIGLDSVDDLFLRGGLQEDVVGREIDGQ